MMTELPEASETLQSVAASIFLCSGDAIDQARFALRALREPYGLTCMHGIKMSKRPSRTCVCHTALKVLIDDALQETT